MIRNASFDFRTETGHAFRLEHILDHQGRHYLCYGLDSYNRDHKVEVLNSEVDWFTWSTSMILDYHARYADDWQGRMKTLREDRAFLDNLFPVPASGSQSPDSGPRAPEAS